MKFMKLGSRPDTFFTTEAVRLERLHCDVTEHSVLSFMVRTPWNNKYVYRSHCFKANILKASSSSKMELATRFGLQLEETTVGDLLIPTFVSNTSDTIYDVDIVMTILEQFMLQGPPTSPPRVKRDFVRRRKSRSAEIIDLEFQESRRSSSASHSSKLKVLSLWMDISKRFPGRKSTCLFQNSFPLLKQFLIFQGSITMIFIEPLTSILR
ncbi:hypothetical protein MTR67_018477 [Solanum verrucosum]|uniref:NPH3 domain-containing protein n=1 Tax=Solanum verrucosum TaxID=315347 RepID=A0AAF0QJR7_SOLVR|nr:hypothetical protein MTR67_018477 [Solanum verrucosum]